MLIGVTVYVHVSLSLKTSENKVKSLYKKYFLRLVNRTKNKNDIIKIYEKVNIAIEQKLHFFIHQSFILSKTVTKNEQ
jgi:hypothetical protein